MENKKFTLPKFKEFKQEVNAVKYTGRNGAIYKIYWGYQDYRYKFVIVPFLRISPLCGNKAECIKKTYEMLNDHLEGRSYKRNSDDNVFTFASAEGYLREHQDDGFKISLTF